MTEQAFPRRRANYGIDGLDALRLLGIVGGVALALGVILFLALRLSLPVVARALLGFWLVVVLSQLLLAVGMLWSSKVGKFRERDRLIDSIPWRGDESVLDVGCGRGLLLIAAAKHLTTGKATGVDIWQARDQTGNRPEAAWENARIEGVTERIEVKKGDARQLLFEDETFDVVISSLVLHNIENPIERAQAVREMARVLKPGGRIAVLDILRTEEYFEVLRESGLQDVNRSEARYLFWFDACTVTANKPV